MGSRRLGVLGGTFNPIHLGHLHIAQCAQRLFGLDQIYFEVTSAPPHKSQENLPPLPHRYAMVSLATARFTSFVPSLVELDPPSSPFSIHTLDKLASRTPGGGGALYFIAGGDSLADVSTWRESSRLLTSYNFIFAVRPGVRPIDPAAVLPSEALPRVRNLVGLTRRRLRRSIQAEGSSRESRIFILDIKALDISASQIRNLASRGKSIRHLVPHSVNEYLLKTHLYGER